MSTVDQVRDGGGKPSPVRGDEEFERAMSGPRQPGADPRPEDGEAGLDPPPVVPTGTVPPGHDDAGEEGPQPPASIGVPAGRGAAVGSGVHAADDGAHGAPPVPEPPPPHSLPEAVSQEALTREVAEALATGDPLAVQRLVTREGRDAFAVAHVLEDAVETLWDASLDSPDGLDRAERAEAALDGVRMGRGPVSFALALDYTLREVGALGADEELTSLDQARSVVDAAPDAIAYEVRDAIARAEVASGVLATEDFGIVHHVPDPGPGLIEDLAALAVPGALTYGWQIPKWSPVKGVVLVVVPNGEDGLNEPTDFTDTDGDGRNTILLNLRLEGAAGRDFGRSIPGADRFRTLTITVEPEESRLLPFLRGEAPLFGEDGLIPSFEIGGGYVNPSLTPQLPGGLDRGLSGPSLIGNIRGGYVSEENQRVYNVNFAVNLGADTAVALAGGAVAGVSAVVPGGQGVAVGSAGLAARVQGLGETARRTAGMLVGGAGWSLEVRFDTADHPNGPGFDGVYYNGERIGLLSDGVQASLEAEARARGITVEELVESGQAEDAIMRGLGGMTR
jgi:hypothetical protein